MAMALPLLGALAGGAGAWGLGFTSMTAIMTGMSVGWVVGSWAMSSMMTNKNQPMDPGAQEMPRFNTAVRGSTVPILFGTNKVACQVTWQNNFQAIRSDSNGSSGGKMGGSGMGGKAPSQTNSTISYTYKIDTVFHLGMSPVTVSLLRGWLGAEQMDNQSVLDINNGAGGGEIDFIAPTDGTQGQAGIAYDETYYADADFSPSSNWSYLETQIGQPITWPGTSWVGFRGLSLGGNASIPQLFWEVGPAAGQMEVNSGAIAQNTIPNNSMIPTGVDANGTCYFSPGAAKNLSAIDVNGNILFSLTDSDVKNMFYARGLINDASFDNAYVQPTQDGTKLIWHIEGNFPGFFAATGISDLPTPGSANTPTIHGYCRHHVNFAGWVYFRKFFELNDSSGNALVLGMIYTDFSNLQTHIHLIATVDDIYNMNPVVIGNHPHINGGVLAFDESAVLTYELQPASNGSFFFAGFDNSTHQDGGNRKGWTTNVNGNARLYFFISKSQTTETQGIGIPTDWKGTYPNGFCFYWEFTGLMPFAGIGFTATSDALTINKDNSWAVDCTDHFIDQDGNGVVPFTDEFTVPSTGAASSSKPCYTMEPHVTHIWGTGDVVVFVMEDNDEQYYQATYGANIVWAEARAFVMNPITGVFTQVDRKGGIILKQGDLGITWSTSGTTYGINIGFSIPWYDYDTKQFYVWSTSNQTGRAFLSRFGTIDFNGQDVTPTYILRQVLVNDYFGLQPGADIIDEVSYEAADNFCYNNNIFVSTQYRRNVNSLQSIELLLALYGGWLAVDYAAGKIKFGVMDLNYGPVRTIDNSHFVVEPDVPPVNTIKGALQDTYNIIRVNYIDRDNNYQQNMAEDRDETDEDLYGPRVREFPADFVMSGTLAQWIASRTLWSNLYTRDQHQFYLGWKDSDLEAGDVITLVDSFGGINQVAQIVKRREVERGKYEIVAAQQLSYVAGRLPSAIGSAGYQAISQAGTMVSSLGYLTASGTVVVSGITDTSSPYTYKVMGPVPAPLDFNAYELPYEYHTSDPQVYVNWAAQDFAAGATLYVSMDGVSYAQLMNLTPYPVYGRFLRGFDANPLTMFEEDVDVVLCPTSAWTVSTPDYQFNTTLNDVSQATMHAGGALMFVGSEMLAYEGVTLIAQNHYRLGRVYRGWGGTTVHAHSSMDLFVKHGSGIFNQEFNTDRIGTTFYYKVAPYNLAGYIYDVSSITAKSYTILGGYYRAQATPTVRYEGYRNETQLYVGSTVDVNLYWHDSARGSGWGTGGFGKNAGGYGGFLTDTLSHWWNVTVVGSGGTIVRTSSVGTPAYTYTSSQNFADNGAWRGQLGITVTGYTGYGPAPRSSVISLNLF
jgi:hypothetical protein